jgi:hypothetical protein
LKEQEITGKRVLIALAHAPFRHNINQQKPVHNKYRMQITCECYKIPFSIPFVKLDDAESALEAGGKSE